jgi:hypothetical protein
MNGRYESIGKRCKDSATLREDSPNPPISNFAELSCGLKMFWGNVPKMIFFYIPGKGNTRGTSR